MPSGTFEIWATDGTPGGNWSVPIGTADGVVNGTGSVNQHIATTGAGGSGTYRADFNFATSIHIDGSFLSTPFGELPVGFTVLTARCEPSGFQTASGGGLAAFQFDIATEGVLGESTFFYPEPLPNMNDLMIGGMGVRFTAGTGSSIISTNTGNGPWMITGTWETQSYQWYLEEIPEEYEDIPFKRNRLTQVNDGDEPPEGSIPFGEPNVDPTYDWWVYDFDDIILYLYQPVSPGTLWVIDDAPTNYGWWKSFEEFQGGALLIINGNPKKPRTYEEITDYSDFMGGFPGAGSVLNHRLIYSGRDYVAQPVIRIFDGLSDRELARVPAVSGVDPVAIISMVTLNGQIYITTFDAGDGSSDSGGPSFTGRVFSLDVASATLTLIGAQFTGGQLPYALAWHNGMLWCGTNPAGDGTEGGKIYFFRPGIDTVWTEDHDFDTNSVGGCTGLVSYQGKLVATTCAAAGENAKVLSRDIAGVWTAIITSTGDDELNAYLSPCIFNDTLYIARWDTTDGSKIYSYDGTTTTLVHTSDYTDRPFIGMYLASGNIYALGGGFELSVALYGSEDGSQWDDLTAFLPGYELEKATPVFAEVRSA